jgi:hypothetical protein
MVITDWGRPTTATLSRLADSRVRQYWDPNHVVAKRMAADARAPQPAHDCCERSGILWDLAAVYPPGASWTSRMPAAVVFNGQVLDVIDEIEAALGVPAGAAAR